MKEFDSSFTLKKLEESMAPISTDEAKSSVIPLVNNAIEKIVAIGIPYLTEFANAKIGKDG